MICTLCPRRCAALRDASHGEGWCRLPQGLRVARAALHHWEEPCISGSRGAGTVFFSGCTLGCVFCQNGPISHGNFGRPVSEDGLLDMFQRLADQGAHNLELVTPTQYLPSILSALDLVRHRLTVPVVYNCGGYERTETIQILDGYVDIYLPDLKYRSSSLSARYSAAPDYFLCASQAIPAMIRQVGAPVISEKEGYPLMEKGVIIRHMVLPGQKEDSKALLSWVRDALPQGSFLISILSQYTPFFRSGEFPEINRRITTYEYQQVVDYAVELGLTEGFIENSLIDF